MIVMLNWRLANIMLALNIVLLQIQRCTSPSSGGGPHKHARICIANVQNSASRAFRRALGSVVIFAVNTRLRVRSCGQRRFACVHALLCSFAITESFPRSERRPKLAETSRSCARSSSWRRIWRDTWTGSLRPKTSTPTTRTRPTRRASATVSNLDGCYFGLL